MKVASLLTNALLTATMQSTSPEGTGLDYAALLAALTSTAAADAAHDVGGDEEAERCTACAPPSLEQRQLMMNEFKATRKAANVIFNRAKLELEALRKALGVGCDDDGRDLILIKEAEVGDLREHGHCATISLKSLKVHRFPCSLHRCPLVTSESTGIQCRGSRRTHASSAATQAA